MASDSATALATQQSIKAYVDAQVATVDTLAEVLANGNTTGANNIIVTNGQKITTNTIDETTAAAGVTIDSVLLKDNAVTATTFNGTLNGAAPAGSLSGTTLASNVVSSSLTSVGTLANLTVTNPISGSVTGSSGSTTGNAATATALQTARNINGASFNGTADITVTAAAGTLTGTTLASGVTASSLTSLGTLSSLTVSGTSSLNGAVTINDAGADVDFRVEGDTNANLIFGDASTDRVGIGTNVPDCRLDARLAGTTSGAVIAVGNAGTGSFGGLGVSDGGTYPVELWGSSLSFKTGNSAYASATERMRLDASGNLGLGVTPSANSLAKAFELQEGFTMFGFSATAYQTANAYYNGGWKYKATGAAAFSEMSGANGFKWNLAASGSADAAITFTQAMTLDASGNLGVGETSPGAKLEIKESSANTPRFRMYSAYNGGASDWGIDFYRDTDAANDQECAFIRANRTGGNVTGLLFGTGSSGTGATEKARITSAGTLLVGKTVVNIANVGSEFNQSGACQFTTGAEPVMYINRQTDDGDIIRFFQAATQEGSISVSGNTVSYNAFAGSHWSQLEDGSKPEILRGTVMEALNELCEWPGEQNERLPKAKVSDTAGSKKVYGVFMDWDNDWTETNDMYVTAVGAFICRVAADVVVEQGDLLESNGDGTARVQADDVIRSSTIGKVTSTVKTHEYEDGTYCVPTVLYCG